MKVSSEVDSLDLQLYSDDAGSGDASTRANPNYGAEFLYLAKASGS